MKKSYKRITDKNFWRNLTSTTLPLYNCGSFALGVDSWFTPYDISDDYTDADRMSMILDLYEDGYSIEDIEEIVLVRDQEEILHACPWIHSVLWNEVGADDVIVAYRIGIDEDFLQDGDVEDDFHFRVRIGGIWFEKNGTDLIKRCANQDINAYWDNSHHFNYDSDIVFFRVDKEI